MKLLDTILGKAEDTIPVISKVRRRGIRLTTIQKIEDVTSHDAYESVKDGWFIAIRGKSEHPMGSFLAVAEETPLYSYSNMWYSIHEDFIFMVPKLIEGEDKDPYFRFSYFNTKYKKAKRSVLKPREVNYTYIEKAKIPGYSATLENTDIKLKLSPEVIAYLPEDSKLYNSKMLYIPRIKVRITSLKDSATPYALASDDILLLSASAEHLLEYLEG